MNFKHSIVYSDPAMYAGWPANHGAWQWGDEMLFGFLRGPYRRQNPMHHIGLPFQKVLARSLDSGETWAVEAPNVDFEGIAPIEPPYGTFEREHILRFCGIYDHGGENAFEGGSFYASFDRGHNWFGPYLIDGIDVKPNEACTARTSICGNLVFLSYGHHKMWGTDYSICARYDRGHFTFVGTVCEDEARAVMPQCVRMQNGDLLCALRRRKTGMRGGWIDLVRSSDDGRTWSKPRLVGSTGSHNGNPPALLALDDGRILCCYGNRDFDSMVCAIGDGEQWKTFVMRTNLSFESDIGYPQLFKRVDGTPVCVYYWSCMETPQQHIACTVLENL